MASYSLEQLLKNRRTILTSSLGAGLIATILAGLGFYGMGRLLMAYVSIAFFASVFWWLFASRGAGTVDGTWVDGWKGLEDRRLARLIALGLAPKPADDEDSL